MTNYACRWSVAVIATTMLIALSGLAFAQFRGGGGGDPGPGPGGGGSTSQATDPGVRGGAPGGGGPVGGLTSAEQTYVTAAEDTMDLTTLITACTPTIDPTIIHALTWHQSGGEPWAFSVSGQHQVLRRMEDARATLSQIPSSPGSVSLACRSQVGTWPRGLTLITSRLQATSRRMVSPIT
jgi:hypothetical protein